MTINVGDRIRPGRAMYYGTLGFFCLDSTGELYLATCDHVLSSLAPLENGERYVYFQLGNSYASKIAVYNKINLVSDNNFIADFAIARVLVVADTPAMLPYKLPYTDISFFSGVMEPVNGGEVLLWGARSAKYYSGVVVSSQSNYSWPHVKYGVITYQKQFSVAVDSNVVMDVGDSGGYVVDINGRLIGIIAALSGIVSPTGNAIIHCVPVKTCCEMLSLKPITK